MVYAYPIDTELIAKHLKKETNRVYWLGVALGLVFGIILGRA
jgi:hypothetical protein